MNFPTIAKIATTNVISLSRKETLCTAIDLMFQSEHRHIIVIDEKAFFGLSIYDVLQISRTHMDQHISMMEIELTPIPTIHKEKNILEALEFVQNNNEYIAVVNSDDSLYGIVTQTDILSSIDPDTMMETFKLSDLLKIKKRLPWVDQNTCTNEIFETMEKYKYDATMIVENRLSLGIITVKDMLKLLKKHADLSRPVKEYMTTPVQTLLHNSTLKEALEFMRDKHFKRIVTVDEQGYLTGSISQKELISIAYTRWVKMIETYQSELHKINTELERKSQKYEKYASTDPLTGIYNRMKFLELFLSEYTVMIQRHNHLSLLVMDIDHFKSINDHFGHNVGDDILVEITKLIQSRLRNVDIFCRWGGEEFVVLLPAAKVEEACKIAEKIRKEISAFSFKNISHHITVSIGVTQIREGDELQNVIERADKALYMAKSAGRNCVKKA